MEKEVDESGEQAQVLSEDSSAKVQQLRLAASPHLLFMFVSDRLPSVHLCVQIPKRIEVHSIHTYVALYKFLPQEQNDLELQ